MIGQSKSLPLLKSRLQPFVVVCTEHLGWGTGRPTSVDRDGLPQPYSDLGPDYSSYIFCVASGPISTSHQLILVIDIV